MKEFNAGLIVGKFQPLHWGHKRMIETALSICDNVYIVIEQKEDDYKCPYIAKDLTNIRNLREEFLIGQFFETFDEHKMSSLNISITPSGDIGIYGEDTKSRINKIIHSVNVYDNNYLDKMYTIRPSDIDVVFYGHDENRVFFNENFPYASCFVFNRNQINISGTWLRNLLILDSMAIYHRHVPYLNKNLDSLLKSAVMKLSQTKEITEIKDETLTLALGIKIQLLQSLTGCTFHLCKKYLQTCDYKFDEAYDRLVKDFCEGLELVQGRACLQTFTKPSRNRRKYSHEIVTNKRDYRD